MSDLTAKFSALEEQLQAADAAMQVDLNAIREALDLVNAQLDTQTINNAANTKMLLAALGQSASCFPCPTPSIVVPPIGTTPIPVNSDHCQRAQAFIDTIHNILGAMDTMQSFNVIGTYNVVSDAISEIIGGIAAGDTVPLPSFPETVGIVGNYVSYAGERLFSGVALLDQFAPIESALVDALYLAGSPDEARTAYDGVIDGADLSLAGGYLIKGVAYTALYSYFFDTATSPDLGAYSGTACGAPSGCITLLSDFDIIMTKTRDDGLLYTNIEIPSWAASISWEINFSDGFNVFWSSTYRADGDPFSGMINSAGFTFTASATWTHTPGATTYFGVGGFYAGLANGSTRNITIISLTACPAV